LHSIIKEEENHVERLKKALAELSEF